MAVERDVTEPPMERRHSWSSSAFHDFFRTEAAGGALLIACAVAALVAANSAWADSYHHLWDTALPVAIAGRTLSLDLHQWINDGFMAIFFLLVGLEIKRESLVGELASMRQASLPIAAAVGGMVVPALISASFLGGGPAARGWAIPMATDIAFALGVLAIAAPRAPGGLKLFLAALAIVDDIGSVLVIAIFYSGALNWGAMAMAGLCLVVLIALNRLHVISLSLYLLVGVALWYFTHESGIHATIAGVLVAFTIPAHTRINAQEFSARARGLLDEFDRTETGDLLVLTSRGQQQAIFGLKRASELVMAPLIRLERALHGFSAFVVMPLFAFANAGVTLTGSAVDRVSLAVALGLAIGKPLGITIASYAVIRTGVAALPQGVTWTALHGCAWLGGIGFTMSLFIATLAFQGTGLLDSAKIGILGASALAGIIGAVIVRRGSRPLPYAEEGRRAE